MATPKATPADGPTRELFTESGQLKQEKAFKRK